MSARGVIAAVAVGGVLFVSAVGYMVAGPDREACKTAISAEVTRALDEGKDASGAENDAAIKRRLRWPCRFQSDESTSALAHEVLNERMPEIFLRSLGEAFPQ
jgi:hypothetical protein